MVTEPVTFKESSVAVGGVICVRFHSIYGPTADKWLLHCVELRVVHHKGAAQYGPQEFCLFFVFFLCNNVQI